jgi:hypothetical protein
MRRRIGLLGLLCLLTVLAAHAHAQSQEDLPETAPQPQVDLPPAELAAPPAAELVDLPPAECGFPGITFGMPTPPPPDYGVAPGPISNYQPSPAPPGPAYSPGGYYNPTGASPPLTGYGPRPGLAYIPDTKVDCKSGRTVAVDPSKRARFKSFFNRLGCLCWATHNTDGCGSLYSEYLFILGSCREFWGDPCTPGPEPLPLPPGVGPIPQHPCCGKW